MLVAIILATNFGFALEWLQKQVGCYRIFHSHQGAVSIRKTVLLGMVIPMLKIRRPTGRLIFNMGIPIPGKTVFYIETGPSLVLSHPKKNVIASSLSTGDLERFQITHHETVVHRASPVHCQQTGTHYCDVIIGAIASQIISLTIVYSTVYSDADHRKHQRSASLAFVRGISRGPVNSPHKWPVTRKIIPFDDVIMI